ncbi:hypothetical protein CWC02_06965 [Pseudoalteromonas sp. S2721]|uniref:hypothetical protein n=1 Tax=Pseudoalteromonas sp. S2721 TaxID=579526 RepID=UPI00110BEB73|nr:hypothetical protein [Pseudoalteromonas sp. S2721]TMP19887.1 hypothetical protein CWC02_06965 [Pseudoalteromonas sp. S2721]
MEPIIAEQEDKTKYKNGDVSISGEVIEMIYCASTDCIIFKTQRGTTGWEYVNKNGKIADRAAVKFNELHELFDTQANPGVLVSLCNIFFSALNAKTIEECDRLFVDIEQRIKDIKTPDKIKSHFILCALIFTTISSFLMLTAYNFSDSSFKYVFLCIAGGSVGALFSILQRNNEVVFNNQIKIQYIYFQATFTVLLGSISGGIIYLLSMSDLALTFANKNIYSLVLLSIVSGFSERMIPELFGKIEKSN